MKSLIPGTVLLLAAILTTGCGLISSHSSCAACERPVHHNTHTVATVNGKKTDYCCPSCALSERKQSGSRVDVVSLTDYETNRTVDPKAAFLVRGSNVNSCAQHGTTAVAPDKHPMATHFDRCSPSLLAFSSDAAAGRFVKEHGGQIVRLPALQQQ